MRYEMEIVVSDDDGIHRYKIHITANSPVEARRAALERAWGLGMSVVKFTKVPLDKL